MADPSYILLSDVTPSQTTPSNNVIVDKTLSSTANLVKLLPSITVLIFQALSPTFSNHGTCRTPNKLLTGFLIGFCAFDCFLVSFTDSFIASNGKLYYGIATIKGLYIINSDQETNEIDMRVLQESCEKYRIRFVDGLHAFFSTLLFVSLAFTDSNVEKCLFPPSWINDLQQVSKSLTLGIGLLCVLIFMVFPTTRKGIGYSETTISSHS